MRYQKLIFQTIVIFGIAVVFLELAWIFAHRTPKPVQAQNPVMSVASTSSTIYLSQLDGTAVSSSAEITPTVVGVMIDNHPDARPQAGLARARIVYEAPVEGGLTRYFAIFNTKDAVAKVGPVRSARPYFLDWISEYGNSSYWHCGGSPDALTLIKQYGIWDVNQFSFDPYFWRDTDKVAPHNLFTNNDNWQKLIAGTTHTDQSWNGWQFSNDFPNSTSTPAAKIQINIGTNYTVGWTYENASGKYFRMIGNNSATDESGTAISASTVLIQEVYTDVIDNDGRLEVTTIGSGKARLLRDGKMIRGTWKKIDRTSRTRFYDDRGNELPLKPGTIWIEVVPQNTAMEVSS